MTDRSERLTLPLLAVALVALPFCLQALGLTLTSATDVVVFAVACLGLNILVGQTGLVSFGHGAFFGLGAYAAAIGQRTLFPGTLLPPTLFALAFVAVAALLLGLLILRRRGVYFSLLTLALSAEGLGDLVGGAWQSLVGIGAAVEIGDLRLGLGLGLGVGEASKRDMGAVLGRLLVEVGGVW